MKVETFVTADETRVVVTGDVDLYSSPELRKAVLAAVPRAKGAVGVDLGGVSYMDSSGVATLVEGLRSAKEHDKAFALVAPSPAVLKVLELARLDSVFEVRPER
ncbi:MAG: STAS domain-containing protein [Thermoanaerobaculales bacterium]|nr:STAS domain-containing protein [Thermoanaerobaculales bacterium]